jgi:pyridoxamine 5'-phosphate oxidase
MSMWMPFTEKARRVIVNAQQEAQTAGADAISTAHILAAVVGDANDSAARLLIDRGVTQERVRAAIGSAKSPTTVDEMLFSPEAKRLIELAFESARTFSHNYVDTEHFVDAVMKMPESRAFEIVIECGCDPQDVRARLQQDAAAGTTPGIETVRRTYGKAELLENTVLRDPVEQLRHWLDDAIAAKLLEPNAMSIATADAACKPSARMVLLRGLDKRGIVFYTSYFSRKGRDLTENAHAAALFYWPPLERQVRIEGTVEQVAEEESDAYFATRPRGHRMSAWASEQSEPVESRDLLDSRMHDYEQRFEGEDVPRPHSWGGYRLRPERFEFWQGRPNRMHDRLEFTRDKNAWLMRRLQP